jgi:RimJ/RimL family protein N-acetyltransferase
VPDDPWLTTPRLVLRRPTPEDLDRLFEIHSDPETYRHLPQSAMTHVDQAGQRLAQWIEHWDEHGFGYAVVQMADEPPAMGFAGAHHHSIDEQPALNLYYRFDPASWGHGYATEAVTAVVGWAADEHSDLPLVARVATNNPSSIALAERVGLARLDVSDPTDPAEHLIFASTDLDRSRPGRRASDHIGH